MVSRRLRRTGVALLALTGCVVDPKQFDTLREQVRIQQRQLNDLKGRQEEQALRVDALNNGFKILGDKAEENSRRIDDIEERAGSASGGYDAPVVSRIPAAPAQPRPAPAPAAVQPAAPAPAPVPAEPSPPPPSPAPPPPAPPAPVVEAPAAPPEPAVPAAAPAARPAPAPPKPEGELISSKTRTDKMYADALMLYSKREYAQAAGVFRNLIESNPADKLAGNAQYWIGECFYSLGKYDEAAAEFEKVEKDFPKSPKVPAALLKQAMSLRKGGREQDAKAAAVRLRSRHPASEEAGRSKELFPE